MFTDSETDNSFFIDAPLNLVSEDLGEIEVIVVVLWIGYIITSWSGAVRPPSELCHTRLAPTGGEHGKKDVLCSAVFKKSQILLYFTP